MTLIEWIILVVIIIVLALALYPKTAHYRHSYDRRQAQLLMTEIADKQQQWLLKHGEYALGVANVSLVANESNHRLLRGYTIDICPSDAVKVPCSTTATIPPSFTIVATPMQDQSADGVLTLNNLGARTRQENAGW